MLGPAQQVVRDPQRDLRRRLIKRLENFTLKVLVAQLVEWVIERLSCRLGLHLVILRLARSQTIR